MTGAAARSFAVTVASYAGNEALQDPRGGRRAEARRADDVLQRDRDAGERTRVLAGGDASVDLGRGGERAIVVEREIRADTRLRGARASEDRARSARRTRARGAGTRAAASRAVRS
jgi:hypothetical protein